MIDKKRIFFWVQWYNIYLSSAGKNELKAFLSKLLRRTLQIWISENLQDLVKTHLISVNIAPLKKISGAILTEKIHCCYIDWILTDSN